MRCQNSLKPIAINFSPQTINSFDYKTIKCSILYVDSTINFKARKLCNHVTSPILKTIIVLKKQSKFKKQF